ncbi:aspartyl/asparaginyl beta-hydroxylase [Edaphobacter aggregans]|uniref:Aspartyl/asparaginyl beta-hydroxylase n=2 Tax=Edaphobacter aggregans TaxID=570835 RepID=A0A3R9PCH1_9BACT|nr:aspartyl/asparaginyl beta-hydroxylase [Edaphobacter aggregans]
MLLEELSNNDRLWFEDQSRQKRVQVQRHTQSIPLRAVARRVNDQRATEDIHESCVTPYAALFPVTMTFLDHMAHHLNGSLERALYVRLLPWSLVYPHIDHGAYYAVRDRYHFVIVSPAGSYLKSGDEEVVMRPGELWWFDNKALHESANRSEEWRVHLIFDIF